MRIAMLEDCSVRRHVITSKACHEQSVAAPNQKKHTKNAVGRVRSPPQLARREVSGRSRERVESRDVAGFLRRICGGSRGCGVSKAKFVRCANTTTARETCIALRCRSPVGREACDSYSLELRSAPGLSSRKVVTHERSYAPNCGFVCQPCGRVQLPGTRPQNLALMPA